MEIESAEIQDFAALTIITKESKAYWGYSAEQMAKWEDDLTITRQYIREKSVYKLLSNGTIVGYYSYFSLDAATVHLDNLFISPTEIGKGFGSILLNDFINRIKKSGITEIVIDSDPNAEEFYSKFGFEKIGQTETSIPNRFLPKMRSVLTQ